MKGRISHRERNDRNDECTEVLPIEDTHPESRIKMKIIGEGGKNIHHIQVRCLGGLKEIPKRFCQTKCPHHFCCFCVFGTMRELQNPTWMGIRHPTLRI